jgi:hypothetical protein
MLIVSQISSQTVNIILNTITTNFYQCDRLRMSEGHWSKA